jgi:hypothetical protein
MINHVKAARVVTEHVVELHFADGFVGRLDLSPALWGPVFEPLKNDEYFLQMRVEDGTIRWPNDADFCPDVLRFWCEAGGVQSQQDTDAHFSQQTASPTVNA